MDVFNPFFPSHCIILTNIGVFQKNVTRGTSRDSASTKQQPNKKKGNSSRKREAQKDANKLPQKPNLVVDARGKSQGITTFKQLYPPTGKSVMVVESATKAKVIQNYLGDMFEVLPSHGHVRDLAARSGSVRPDDDFSMVWEVPSAAWTPLKSIKVSLNGYAASVSLACMQLYY